MIEKEDVTSSDDLVLSKQDQHHVNELEKKFQLVRDNVASVATGRSTGLYLYGTGGCGKSHNVLGELKRLGVPFKLHNSRLSGRGLYNLLARFPDAVHVLEDLEGLFRDAGAKGVLRSALWSQSDSQSDGPMERPVTWGTQVRDHEFVFTGGLIMTGNRPFPDQPELDAVKTRIGYLHLSVSDNEIVAMMRKIALQGYQRGADIVEPHECLQVCEHVVSECQGLNRLLDLRLFVNSLCDYAQWNACASGCHWKDLVSARVKERPTQIREAKTAGERNEQKVAELELVNELAELEDREEAVKFWCEQSGKSKATFYRRLAELKQT